MTIEERINKIHKRVPTGIWQAGELHVIPPHRRRLIIRAILTADDTLNKEELEKNNERS